MSDYFHTYYSDRIKKITHDFAVFEKEGDESTLHEIRIGLKKILTILSFLNYVYDHKRIKNASHKLKNIFHKAGKIREAQLLQIWITKSKLKSLQNAKFNNDEVSENTIDFQKETKNTHQSILEIKHIIEKYAKPTDESEIRKYIFSLTSQIHILLHTIPSTDQWHTIRKKSKQLIFAFSWLQKESGVNNQPFTRVFKNLQNEIGNWHDKMVMRETLSQKKDNYSVHKMLLKDFDIARVKLTRSIRYSENKIKLLLRQAAKI